MKCEVVVPSCLEVVLHKSEIMGIFRYFENTVYSIVVAS